jgi:hypothetical protein
MSWQSSLTNVSGMGSDGTNLYVLGTYASNYGVHIVNISSGLVTTPNFIPASTIVTNTGNSINLDVTSFPQRCVSVDNSHIYILYNGFFVARFNKSTGLIDNFSTFNAKFNGSQQVGGALYGMSIDSVNNFLYVSKTDRSEIAKIDLASPSFAITTISTGGIPAGSFVVNNYLYCVDRDYGLINKYGPLNGTPVLVTNAFPSVAIGNGAKTAFTITADSSNLYVGNDTATASGVLTKIQLSSGKSVQLPSNTNREMMGLVVIGTTIYAGLGAHGLFSTSTFIPNTQLYLGNATVTTTGDFNLAGTVMSSTRFPSDAHELVPRAYVDNYISSVVSY